jgi:hypothetical protein
MVPVFSLPIVALAYKCATQPKPYAYTAAGSQKKTASNTYTVEISYKSKAITYLRTNVAWVFSFIEIGPYRLKTNINKGL